MELVERFEVERRGGRKLFSGVGFFGKEGEDYFKCFW